MHVGLPYTCVSGDSGYLSDTAITILTLADILQNICNVSVTLVCMNAEGTKWWPDYEHLHTDHSVIGYSPDLKFDAVVDVQCQMSPTLRRRMTSGTVIGFRYDNCLVNEIQDFTYPRSIFNTHNVRGEVDAVWVWEENVDASQIPVLEELYGCPVVRMPFIGSRRCMERVNGSDDSCVINPLRFTIVATNTDSTSSMIVPLVGLNSLPQVDSCHCVGSNTTQETQFYQDNILKHLHYKSAIQYTDALQLPTVDDGIYISHLRFVRFLPHQIHLAWMYGHRLVHNSDVLVNAGIRDGFFPNNSTHDMISAIEQIHDNGMSLDTIRERLVEKVCAVGDKARSVWQKSFKRRIRITFSDMWEGFDPSVNFFVDMIRWMGDWNEVVGEAWTGGGSGRGHVDLHICGPFGFAWKSVPVSTPIVFFSGERWEHNAFVESDKRIRLFLTHDPVEDERHIRFPLWITYLNLFGNETGSSVKQNPMRAPLDWATTSQGGGNSDSRKHFCAFVVSNPGNQIRNQAYSYLNQYRHVDSGGQFQNTIGGPIETLYGGGGGGELAKLAFYRERQFCIAFENSGAPGYVTEKLLHAKMAGCIPIYWGDEMACTDFDARGFISMCGKAPNEIVGIVDELLQDPAQCAYMASIPPLGEKELRAVWERMEHVTARIRKILGQKVVYKESARNLIKMTEAPSVPPVRHAPLYVSFATQRYIPSVLQSLDTLKVIRTRECPGLQYLLYVGDDMTDADTEPIQSIGSWISIRKLPTDVSPAIDTFPDFWALHHFGWRLWILNQTVNEFTDKLIVYSDTDVQWQRMYDEMFTKAWDTGACFVLDHNLNKHWCSSAMIESMNVTADELEAPQNIGEIVAMRGGHAGACAFFKECYQLALNPLNLEGRKLIRMLPSGQAVGHRHDQSIMSVMRVRKGGEFGTVDVDVATCRESLRRTHLTGCPIYHHRGTYTVHKRVLPRTDDVWIINLNRRADRIQEWAKAYPELANVTQRFQAIDGRELHMTPAISELFQHNDFKWKRSVVGCALSHILLWAQLACETSAVESYLILEDDMRFGCEDWANALQDALGALPDDVDVAMLGGILPSNRAVYADAIASVNDVWSRITPNTLFTKSSVPVFHHCTYSYYLTKQGAKKLLRALLTGAGGCFTSIDHFLGFPHSGFVRYVMTQPIAQCFQETDPQYVNSQFDNFDRVDSFDSDIWNNNEVFSQGDRESGAIYGVRQSLYPVMTDVLRQVSSDIQTRTLLEPAQYMQALAEGNEIVFLQTFSKILENEVTDPATIRIWQRKNVCCIAEGDTGINDTVLAEICGEDVKIVRVPVVDMERACVYAKLFAVHPAMSIQEIVERVDVTGCIPLYLRAEGDDVFWGQLRGTLPIMELRTEGAVQKFVQILQRDLRKAEMYRAGLLQKVRGSGS